MSRFPLLVRVIAQGDGHDNTLVSLPAGREDPMKTAQRYYHLEFLLRGKTEWYPGMTLATDEQDAIRNFLSDYSPSMGTIAAVRVFGT